MLRVRGSFATCTKLFLNIFIAAGAAFGQSSGPIGLVIEANNARARRAGVLSSIPVRAGDLVFAGDTVFAENGSGTVAYCPTRSSYSLQGRALKFENERVTSETGKELSAARKLSFCILPAITPGARSDLQLSANRIQTTGDDRATEPKPPVEAPPAVQAKLEAIDRAIIADPRDLLARLARAITLAQAGLRDESAREYERVQTAAPAAFWAGDMAKELIAQSSRSNSGAPHILGVVVGISQYERLPDNRQLLYAHKDAEAFYQYLTSPRGGANPQDVLLLLDKQARLADIRNAIAKAFAEAKPADTVVLFIAAHGIAEESGTNRGAYILAHDSDPQGLPMTGLNMEELQELTTRPLTPRQVRVFIDACHSGVIGQIASHKFNRFMTDLLNEDRPSTLVFGLMASRQNELSYECANLEHGAFTFYLLRGLNTGEAVDNPSGPITTDSLIEYVKENVRGATGRHQNPEPRGRWSDRIELANTSLPGVAVSSAVVTPGACVGSRGISAGQASSDESAGGSKSRGTYSDSLQRGLLLPGVPGSAFDILTGMQASLSPAEYRTARNRLFSALENAGQKILLRYLQGEAVPQRREDFESGERFFAAASRLIPGDAFVESRLAFCRGRKQIFDHQYDAAIQMLEQAIRLSPSGAYSYNALGIAYLERADFEKANAAFRDAVQFSPHWAYARHNLALALTQAGRYQEAVATYRAAAALAPDYAYIPYNLGLLFERLNRLSEARESLRTALAIDPKLARAWNAVGLSYFLEHRFSQGESAYRTALQLSSSQTDRLAIRHDLGVLLVAGERSGDAIPLWRANLAEKPDDLPSLIGLSQLFTARGDTQSAIETLSILIAAKPDFVGARMQYAKALAQAGQLPEAETQLRHIAGSAPETAVAYESLADAYAARKLDRATSENKAMKLYREAFAAAVYGKQRSRIEKKMKALRP